MPGEYGTVVGGSDRVVTATRATTLSPRRNVGTALSVESGAQAKADIDYGKRET